MNIPNVIPAKAGIQSIKLLYFFLLIILCGCGDAGFQGEAKSSGAGYGSANLIVTGSKNTASGKSYSVIKEYRVTISGRGIEEPIETRFDGESDGGIIDGVPVGEGREIKVEAINSNGQPIREGIAEGVKVSPGINEVEVGMDSIPIFVNLKDGGVIASNRLRFELFADPEETLRVEDSTNGENRVLNDLNLNTSEVYPDIATGVAVLTPGGVGVGERVFRASSVRTGKSSLVAVKVIDGKILCPAPFYSGGYAAVSGDHLRVGRAGSSIYADAKSGVIWPRYLGAVLTEY